MAKQVTLPVGQARYKWMCMGRAGQKDKNCNARWPPAIWASKLACETSRHSSAFPRPTAPFALHQWTPNTVGGGRRHPPDCAACAVQAQVAATSLTQPTHLHILLMAGTGRHWTGRS